MSIYTNQTVIKYCKCHKSHLRLIISCLVPSSVKAFLCTFTFRALSLPAVALQPLCIQLVDASEAPLTNSQISSLSKPPDISDLELQVGG